MGTIFLLVLFLFCVWTRIKCFKAHEIDMSHHLKHENPERGKAIMFWTAMFLALIGSLIDVWGTLYIDSGYVLKNTLLKS